MSITSISPVRARASSAALKPAFSQTSVAVFVARTQGPANVAQGTQVGLTVLGEVSFYPDPGQG